ncbi:MAG: hypothetical protein ACRDL1_06415 [Solirubrobacterales bacterium]
MSDHLGIRFQDGDAFPADQSLARWLTVCAMALNDLLLVNRWLMPRLQEQIEAASYESVYLGRLAGAHLFEVAKFLEGSDRNVSELQEFIATLDADPQAAYEKVKSVGPRSGSEFAQQLERARNQFFHYSELLPHAEDHEKLKAAMDAHAETTGAIRDEGTAIEGFRASFADDIAVELSFPEEEVDLKAFVSQVSEHIAAFLEFAFAALPKYVESLPPEVWEYIEPE